jgi:hypothetical protein
MSAAIYVQCCRRVNEFSKSTPDAFCRCEYNEARRLRSAPRQIASPVARYVIEGGRFQVKATAC